MDDVELSSLFRKISKGRINRIPLELAITILTEHFKKSRHLSCQIPLSEVVNELYLRKIDTISGTNAHVLMTGGPRYLKGNPDGCLHSKVFFPVITFEQFRMYAKVRWI